MKYLKSKPIQILHAHCTKHIKFWISDLQISKINCVSNAFCCRTSMVLTNSSEATQDLVLSMQQLSSSPNPSNVVKNSINGNGHSTNGSGNESDEQMEIVTSNDNDSQLQSDSSQVAAACSSSNQQPTTNGNSANRVQFNADLICHHGEQLLDL